MASPWWGFQSREETDIDHSFPDAQGVLEQERGHPSSGGSLGEGKSGSLYCTTWGSLLIGSCDTGPSRPLRTESAKGTAANTEQRCVGGDVDRQDPRVEAVLGDTLQWYKRFFCLLCF